jgi:hypothetical protein
MARTHTATRIMSHATITLDTLLYGSCAWEEVQAFFAKDGEFPTEDSLITAIKKHLRTGEDRAWLERHDLSLEDLLNGRYPLALGHEVSQILGRWNQRLGCRYFATGAQIQDLDPAPQPETEDLIHGYHPEGR